MLHPFDILFFILSVRCTNTCTFKAGWRENSEQLPRKSSKSCLLTRPYNQRRHHHFASDRNPPLVQKTCGNRQKKHVNKSSSLKEIKHCHNTYKLVTSAGLHICKNVVPCNRCSLVGARICMIEAACTRTPCIHIATVQNGKRNRQGRHSIRVIAGATAQPLLFMFGPNKF
jgi:hypothetical protein